MQNTLRPDDERLHVIADRFADSLMRAALLETRRDAPAVRWPSAGASP
jgi:hypothetical protein